MYLAEGEVREQCGGGEAQGPGGEEGCFGEGEEDCFGGGGEDALLSFY